MLAEATYLPQVWMGDQLSAPAYAEGTVLKE